MFDNMYTNRTLCDVLEEMRKTVKTLNFSYLLSLIEEVQSMGNRMEAGLYDKNDYEQLLEDREELNNEVKEIKKELKELKKKKEKK